MKNTRRRHRHAHAHAFLGQGVCLKGLHGYPDVSEKRTARPLNACVMVREALSPIIGAAVGLPSVSLVSKRFNPTDQGLCLDVDMCI